MTGSGQVDLPDVQECLGYHTGCLVVVGRLYWMSVSGQVALPDVWEWSGGPFGCPEGPPKYPGVVGWPIRMSRRPTQMSKIGREALPNVREW